LPLGGLGLDHSHLIVLPLMMEPVKLLMASNASLMSWKVTKAKEKVSLLMTSESLKLAYFLKGFSSSYLLILAGSPET